MKGLLLKDFYTLVTQARIFLLLVLVFSLMPGYSMASFAVVYAGLIPITALAYDERSKWDSLAAMLPYTPRQIVASKYVLGYICVSGASLLALVLQVAASLVKGQAYATEALIYILLMAGVGVIFLAICLPFMFRYGVEKGRVFFIIIIGVLMSAVALLGENVRAWLQALSGSLWTFLALVLLAALALSLASMRLATRLYARREL